MPDKKEKEQEKIDKISVCPYNDFIACFGSACPAYRKKTQFYSGSGCIFVDDRIPPYMGK